MCDSLTLVLRTRLAPCAARSFYSLWGRGFTSFTASLSACAARSFNSKTGRKVWREAPGEFGHKTPLRT